MNTFSPTLSKGTTLRGKVYTYRIEKVLGQGSFGITYLASTKMQGPLGEVTVQVAVKEFFAKELDSRKEDGTVTARTVDGVAHKYAKAFLRESENLSKMKHPGIVNVLESFEDKGTCYYAMEYLSGGNLDDKVKGTGIPEKEALPLIRRVGEALSYMHEQKVMHLDLKPKNIMLKADGSPVIIDFGLSKQYDGNGEPESSTTIGLGTPGYAPLEQANQTSGRTFQPTLDVYALGATLFKMLTGETPPPASDIFNEGFPEGSLKTKNVSPVTIEAIRKAMSAAKKDRPQRVEALLSLLDGKVTASETAESEETTIPEKPSPKPMPSQLPKPSVILSVSEESKPPVRNKSKARLWALLGCAVISVVLLSLFSGNASVSEPSGEINGYGYVDLGLPSGLLWATCNVGAISPYECGDYFAWGETTPKKYYSLNNYRFWTSGNMEWNATFSKYNKASDRGIVDNKTRLEVSDDAAHSNWGDSWRMPTMDEFRELMEHCTWVWAKHGRRKGYLVRGKNGNSIFLPAAGDHTRGKRAGRIGLFGFYWSSSLLSEKPEFARCIHFDKCLVYCSDESSYCRCLGLSVRPVTERFFNTSSLKPDISDKNLKEAFIQ